ncbi:asparagine synthase (glutamine-hydrolyzing) [Elusimicrobiota bacterium]
MCGICGILDIKGRPLDVAAGARMVGLLHHRGPESSGYVTYGDARGAADMSVFLGHSRLKIIDLSDAAHQPMTDADNDVAVVFNGEIYNFVELRSDLEALGHNFKSRSDTEVLLAMYKEYGEAAIRKLDGMFAFAIWDKRRRKLILSRDRSGKKPLYYYSRGAVTVFASEIKAILACPWVDAEIAHDQIPAYLLYGYIPALRTIYRHIYQVPPASFITIGKEGFSGPFKYWELKFGNKGLHSGKRFDERSAINRVRELLEESVKKRLVSDVPLGVLLSGGLDSSIITGIASKIVRGPVRTFSVGFSGAPSYDERSYASVVAKRFETLHTEFLVNPDAASLMEKLLWHHDQPYGDSSAIPTFIVSQMARMHVTVALVGDGADEIFAGYDRFQAALLADSMPRFMAPIGLAIARILPRTNNYHDLRTRMERFFRGHEAPVVRRYLGWSAHFDPSTLPDILGGMLKAEYVDNAIQSGFYEYMPDNRSHTLLQQLLYLNFSTYLHDDLHVKMDRMSMACSLETRSPMLDTALMEFAATLPDSMKIKGGQKKYILRRAFEGMLPNAVLARKKHGFGVPVGNWFRSDLGNIFKELVLAPGSRSEVYLNKAAVNRLFQEHIACKTDHGQRLWNLMNLEMWLRMRERSYWKDPPPPVSTMLSSSSV